MGTGFQLFRTQRLGEGGFHSPVCTPGTSSVSNYFELNGSVKRLAMSLLKTMARQVSNYSELNGSVK